MNKVSKVYKIMATTAIAGLLLGGTIFEPTTTFAAKNKKVTDTKTKSVKNNSNKASMTQNGITLSATNVSYDGNFIQFDLKRSGKGLKSGIAKFGLLKGHELKDQGSISKFKILIDDKSINKKGEYNSLMGYSLLPGATSDTVKVTIYDTSGYGEQFYSLPDKFKLSFEINLVGTKQLFKLDIPVQSPAKSTKLLPKITKKYGDLSVSLNQINLTSKSARFNLIEQGLKEDERSDLFYEFFDDNGVVLNKNSFQGAATIDGKKYNDIILQNVNKNSKSVTIKAFKIVLENPNDLTSVKIDENGEMVKQYIQELEMKVDLK
jgi:hypothetical protein